MTIPDLLNQVGEMLVDREHGRLHGRIIMQPLVAITLAVRVALRDARAGRPPYLFWSLFSRQPDHLAVLRLMWQDVGRLFLSSLAIDLVYQLIVWHRIYPTQALLVAVFLAFIPYLLVRGPATRIARIFMSAEGNSPPQAERGPGA